MTRYLWVTDIGCSAEQALGHVFVEGREQRTNDTLTVFAPCYRGKVQRNRLGPYAPESPLACEKPVALEMLCGATKVRL